MNGSQSHCGSCQAAHAAVTPTLLDNTFSLSHKHLVTSPYDQLSPIKQTLVQRCLRLNPSHIESLNTASQIDREQFLQQHTHPSFPHLQAGLFASNSTAFMRNATFEGPTAANRIDCHLESVLRPIEDSLATQCTDGALSPKEALNEFHRHYALALEELKSRFEQVLPAMQALQQAEDTLATAESVLLASLTDPNQDLQNHISQYKEALAQYLACFNRFSPLSGGGVPQICHKQIIDALKERYSLYLLRGIHLFLNTYSDVNNVPLPLLNTQLSALIRCRAKAKQLPNWSKMTDEIALRQDEVSHQTHILSLGFQAIYDLTKMELSAPDATGKWTSPSRSMIANSLIRRAESPMAPPRKRARTSNALESGPKMKELEIR